MSSSDAGGARLTKAPSGAASGISTVNPAPPSGATPATTVASEVTVMSRMRSTMPSPGSAPSTATGRVTSWPPLMAGVIMGPQQPGAVLATMWPPSRTVPSTSALGPMMPSQKRSTITVSAATPVVVAMSHPLVGALRVRPYTGRPGAEQAQPRAASPSRSRAMTMRWISLVPS